MTTKIYVGEAKKLALELGRFSLSQDSTLPQDVKSRAGEFLRLLREPEFNDYDSVRKFLATNNALYDLNFRG